LAGVLAVSPFLETLGAVMLAVISHWRVVMKIAHLVHSVVERSMSGLKH
jgi:hypothetical protein